MSRPPAALSLLGLTKTYPGPVTALHDLSLEIAPGELVAILGPSGCGKSTLLRLVAGLDEPTAGQIQIAGQPADRLSPRERDVVLVFQSHTLFPHLTAFDNMAYGLRLRGVGTAEIAARVGDAARTLGIADLLARRPGSLSGGERQRIALGRALVRRPRLVLLDEPLSSLDAHLRAELRQEIVRLHRRLGAVTLLVTHDQAEASSLADRVVVLKEGTLQQAGEPASLVEQPANRFVAGFVGVPPMSFLEGQVSIQPGGLVFEHPSLVSPVPDRWRSRLAISGPGTAVVLGVRPEDWHLAGGAPRVAGSGGRGNVEWVERMGARTFAHVRLGGAVVIAGCEAFVPRTGDDVWLVPDAERTFFFDPGTGHAL